MARKPAALARELLRNFPKGKHGKSRRRTRRPGDGTTTVATGQAGPLEGNAELELDDELELYDEPAGDDEPDRDEELSGEEDDFEGDEPEDDEGLDRDAA
jgi:hypothetical protein